MGSFNFAFSVASTCVQHNITGITPDQFAALIRDHTNHSETQKKLIVRLETDLELNHRQIRAALNILGEANVPPERLAEKLVEIV